MRWLQVLPSRQNMTAHRFLVILAETEFGIFGLGLELEHNIHRNIFFRHLRIILSSLLQNLRNGSFILKNQLTQISVSKCSIIERDNVLKPLIS